VQTKRAVQQAAAAPREESRISPDIRQITKSEVRRGSEENRSENVRRIGEQMAAKFREVARRSEGVAPQATASGRVFRPSPENSPSGWIDHNRMPGQA
jgi:hypothetical protein